MHVRTAIIHFSGGKMMLLIEWQSSNKHLADA